MSLLKNAKATKYALELVQIQNRVAQTAAQTKATVAQDLAALAAMKTAITGDGDFDAGEVAAMTADIAAVETAIGQAIQDVYTELTGGQ